MPISIMSCVLLDNSEWIFGTYKPNYYLLLLRSFFFTFAHVAIFFYLAFLIIGSQIEFIFILGLFNRSLLSNICSAPLWCLILQCFSLPIILTSSHKGRWFPFLFHIWSDMPNFLNSPHTTAFWYSSSFTFSGLDVSPFYTLPQLHRKEYIQLLFMLYSVESLTWKRYFWRVKPLLNTVLISYDIQKIFKRFKDLYIFWLFVIGQTDCGEF